VNCEPRSAALSSTLNTIVQGLISLAVGSIGSERGSVRFLNALKWTVAVSAVPESAQRVDLSSVSSMWRNALAALSQHDGQDGQMAQFFVTALAHPSSDIFLSAVEMSLGESQNTIPTLSAYWKSSTSTPTIQDDAMEVDPPVQTTSKPSTPSRKKANKKSPGKNKTPISKK
jgi:hypothetical protein